MPLAFHVMITIISGTNRPQSNTLKVAHLYANYLTNKGITNHLLSLEGMDICLRSDQIKDIEQKYLIPSQKIIFIIPEYNGSYPGCLKLFLDNTDVRKVWQNKKALITGLADGRAGNLRGLDHLTNVLNYLKVNVFYNKIPLSKINSELDELGNWQIDATKNVIEEQIEGFLAF